jgi:hypothetical protein
MAILGNIIKSALEFTDMVLPDASPVEEQSKILKQLLEKARDTAFGREYDFESILKAKDMARAFAEKVPIHDYDQMHQKWWKRQMEGEENVTWPGIPEYYALSAGTTGSESKRIPATEDMLEAIRKTSMLQILAISNFDLPAEFFEKEIMMLGSTTDLADQGSYQEGEISGISAKNIPGWFDRFYRPGREISSISDWDEKVDAIARKAKNWDVGAMAGIPSWNELMLKRVIEYNKAKNIHEVWPNLMVFASGGVAFEPYRKTFESLAGKPMIFIDTYLASEGFIAFQNRPHDDMAMALSTSSGLFFEFVPFVPENIDDNGSLKQGVEALTLADVEENKEYVLLISSVAGAWRYMIGDTVRFTDKHRAEILITGRTKHFLNVVGSQLSVIQMNDAISMLADKFNLEIPEFTVAAIRDGEDYKHHWYLGMEGSAEAGEMAATMDEFLKGINKAYKMARDKALKNVEVTTVPPAVFYAWNEQEQKMGGQVKMPRVMKEEEFRKWEKFVREHP